MKKLIVLIVALVFTVTLAGCDIIEEEIERAESIELEDYSVDMANQNVLLKITSNADEQVIEEVEINGERYDLESQGDDWYLLDEVPIAKTYEVGDLYYLTGVGARVTFSVDYDITLNEALDRAPAEQVSELVGTVTKGDYTFEASDEGLATIESDNDFTTETLEDWVMLVLEDGTPRFAVVEHDDTVYIVKAPDTVDEYIE